MGLVIGRGRGPTYLEHANDESAYAACADWKGGMFPEDASGIFLLVFSNSPSIICAFIGLMVSNEYGVFG